jgi:hypothetical protein
MFMKTVRITKTTQSLRRFYSSNNGCSDITPVASIVSSFATLSTEKFRQLAFTDGIPLHIIAQPGKASYQEFPAATKWFRTIGAGDASSLTPCRQYDGKERLELNYPYFELFQQTMLPYELMTPIQAPNTGLIRPILMNHLKEQGADPRSSTFVRFYGPLSLFLGASMDGIQRLYIAQAQLIDLPPGLREDLPTPPIVKEAGKGDIYDANVWLGCPPTYTPLHKDPNPNLFVQLASRKVVRLFEPSVGDAIFADVKRQLGESGRASLRGIEMMEGKERELLDEAVWGTDVKGGYETVVRPMDALFIPKGWWHSIKSIGDGVNASVNWWFR